MMTTDRPAPAAGTEWTADECAAYLNVRRDTWHSYVNRPGKLNPTPQPTRRIGRTPVWDAREVAAWAERRHRPTNI